MCPRQKFRLRTCNKHTVFHITYFKKKPASSACTLNLAYWSLCSNASIRYVCKEYMERNIQNSLPNTKLYRFTGGFIVGQVARKHNVMAYVDSVVSDQTDFSFDLLDFQSFRTIWRPPVITGEGRPNIHAWKYKQCTLVEPPTHRKIARRLSVVHFPPVTDGISLHIYEFWSSLTVWTGLRLVNTKNVWSGASLSTDVWITTHDPCHAQTDTRITKNT